MKKGKILVFGKKLKDFKEIKILMKTLKLNINWMNCNRSYKAPSPSPHPPPPRKKPQPLQNVPHKFSGLSHLQQHSNPTTINFIYLFIKLYTLPVVVTM